jgi:hypothetical protein
MPSEYRTISEQMQVQAVAQANSMQESEKGDEVRATRKRDQAMDQLEEWMSFFNEIAKIALEGSPGLLKKLGIYDHTPGKTSENQGENNTTAVGTDTTAGENSKNAGENHITAGEKDKTARFYPFLG